MAFLGSPLSWLPSSGKGHLGNGRTVLVLAKGKWMNEWDLRIHSQFFTVGISKDLDKSPWTNHLTSLSLSSFSAESNLISLYKPDLPV